MAEAEIKEGFLCPICMKDLGGVADLQEHFEEEHSQEDKAVIQHLKGLFGKAKRKILGKEREDDAEYNPFLDVDVPSQPLHGYDPTVWEPQELGAVRSHTDGFKSVRDRRIDRFVVETNKLLIRLDKLIGAEHLEGAKRKAFEKSIVPWAPDADVNLCTTCGQSFGLLRRRHHCRLCGGIICNKCSHFMPFSYAKKLTNPSFIYEGEGFHRSGSNTSLNSIISPEGEPHIRTCIHCRELLERRDQQTEQRTSKPMVVQLYERMNFYIDDAEQIFPKFMDMAEALNGGETTYSLGEAQLLRKKLVKLYESIDALSKRIAILGLDAEEPPSPKVCKLQQSIRVCASSWLQDNMMGMQGLPTEQELTKLQEAKRIETQRRIEAEKAAAAEKERQRQEEKKNKSAQNKNEAAPNQAKPTGWKPAEVNAKTNPEDDPMIQQMNIIRAYIRQAKQAQKWDEVKMLEDNLKELHSEYVRATKR